jgi:hypothetical protein
MELLKMEKIQQRGFESHEDYMTYANTHKEG